MRVARAFILAFVFEAWKGYIFQSLPSRRDLPPN